MTSELIRCPNSKCQRSTFRVSAVHSRVKSDGFRSELTHTPLRPVGIGSFQFLPTTAAPLSPHVPKAVAEDYAEAYLVRKLSPKASATLARRALQGMVRDFWGVSKRTLAEELKAIEASCDHDLYQVMMAVKGVGNIGAHPERNVNLIVEIEPEEAQQLLDLIHLLDAEWYVARAGKAVRIAKVRSIGETKASERADPKPATGEA